MTTSLEGGEIQSVRRRAESRLSRAGKCEPEQSATCVANMLLPYCVLQPRTLSPAPSLTKQDQEAMRSMAGEWRLAQELNSSTLLQRPSAGMEQGEGREDDLNSEPEVESFCLNSNSQSSGVLAWLFTNPKSAASSEGCSRRDHRKTGKSDSRGKGSRGSGEPERSARNCDTRSSKWYPALPVVLEGDGRHSPNAQQKQVVGKEGREGKRMEVTPRGCREGKQVATTLTDMERKGMRSFLQRH